MDWESYTEQLDFSFLANGVSDTKTRAILQTNLPTVPYQLAKDLAASVQSKNDAITYNVIMEQMQQQLKRERSVLAARSSSVTRESVSHYIAP